MSHDLAGVSCDFVKSITLLGTRMSCDLGECMYIT